MLFTVILKHNLKIFLHQHRIQVNLNLLMEIKLILQLSIIKSILTLDCKGGGLAITLIHSKLVTTIWSGIRLGGIFVVVFRVCVLYFFYLFNCCGVYIIFHYFIILICLIILFFVLVKGGWLFSSFILNCEHLVALYAKT